MAASICTGLAHFISESLKSRFSSLTVKLWSDSEIVLHWLHSSKPLKQFIANPTKEIKRPFSAIVWNHFQTADNPADLLTHGISAHKLQSSLMWKHGPRWPAHVQVPVATLETLTSPSPESLRHLRKKPPLVTLFQHLKKKHPLVNLFQHNLQKGRLKFTPSLMPKLVGVSAYVLRFLGRIHKLEAKHVGLLICPPKNDTSLFTNGSRPVKHWPTLMKQLTWLCLFLDCDGFLHCRGRIHNAPLDDSAKFLFLLPSSHLHTKLSIHDAHVKQLHPKANATVTELHQTFWITSHMPALFDTLKARRDSLQGSRSGTCSKGFIAQHTPFRIRW